jgi:hypothetical protein
MATDDMPPLSDDELAAIAEEAFLEMDKEEAEDTPHPPSRIGEDS